MEIQDLAAALNAQIADGYPTRHIKILAPNGAIVDPVELVAINGDQDLIPSNPPAESYVLLKCPQA